MLVNKQDIKGDGFQGCRKIIQREKTAQSQADIENKQEIALLSGSQLQTRYVEQWLNDVLKDAQELDMPGILNKPEHQKPLQRYEIDRINLSKFGLSDEIIDRVYRSLFVHSVGFFGLLKEATKNLQEGKDYLRINIWKVFQILLECACQTDYKLITQKMEQDNVKTINELREKNAKLTQDYMQKDDELSLKLQRLKTEQNLMESDRVKFQDEKMKVYDELAKIQKKIEEEIKLRLFFESKLNSLHHMNMEHESNFTLLREKYDKLFLENTDLEQQFKLIHLENKDLIQYKIQAEETIKHFSLKEQIEDKHKQLRKEKNQSIILELDQKSQNLVEKKSELQTKISKIVVNEINIENMQFDMQNKNYQVDSLQSLNQNYKEQIQKLEKQIDELKINKLQFIDVSNQNQLLKRQIIYQEDILKDVDLKQNTQYSKIEDLEVMIGTQKGQISSLESMMKNDQEKNQILENKVHELTCLKNDLERRLKNQIQQCEDLQEEILHLEKIYKNIKKENLSLSEEKFKMKISFEKTLLEFKNASDTIQEIKSQQNQKELILRQTLNTVTFEKNELQEQNKKDIYKIQYYQDQYKLMQNENVDLLQAKQIQEKELDDLKVQFEQIKQKKENLNLKCIQNEQQIEEQICEIKKLNGEIKSLNQINLKEKQAFDTILKRQKTEFNIIQMQSEDNFMKLQQNQDKLRLVNSELSKIKKVLGKFGWKFLKLIFFQQGFQEQKLQLNVKIQELGDQVIDQLQIISQNTQKIFELESQIKNRDQQNQEKGEQFTKNIQKILSLQQANDNLQKQIKTLNLKMNQLNDKLNIKTDEKETQTTIDLIQNMKIDEYSQTSEYNLIKNQQIEQQAQSQTNSILFKHNLIDVQESIKSQKSLQKQIVYQNIVSVPSELKQNENDQIVVKRTNKKDKKQKKSKKQYDTFQNDDLQNTQIENAIEDQNLEQIQDAEKQNLMIDLESEKGNIMDYQNIQVDKDDSLQDKVSISVKKYQSIQNSIKSQNLNFKIKSVNDKLSSKIQSVKLVSSHKEVISNAEVQKSNQIDMQRQESQIQSLSSSSEQNIQQNSTDEQEFIMNNLNSQQMDNQNTNNQSTEYQVEQEYEKVIQIDENHIYSYFSQRTKQQIFNLVKQLNQLNQVKLCGGLGMCFDCRNEHLGRKWNPEIQFQNIDYKMQQIEKNREIKGTYFKKELQKIIKGYMPPTSQTLSTRFFETYQFNKIDDEQKKDNLDDFITKASSLQGLSNKNINFEDQQILNQSRILDLARRGLTTSNGQSLKKRIFNNEQSQFGEESSQIQNQYYHQYNNNFEKNQSISSKQKIRGSVANLYYQNKMFNKQGGYIIQNDPVNLVITSGSNNKKSQQLNFNSSQKEFEQKPLKRNNNKIIKTQNITNANQNKNIKLVQTGNSNENQQIKQFIQIQKKSFESIPSLQNQMLPTLESLKSEEGYRPKTNQQPQENKQNLLKSSEAYSNIEIARNQYQTSIRSMSQKGKERNIQTQNSIDQLRSQSQLLSSKYEFQINKIQNYSRNHLNNQDLSEIAINVEQYLQNNKQNNQSPNAQQQQMQPNVPILFQTQNKEDNESEIIKNIVLVNKFINTVSDANLNDTIRENQEDYQSNQNSLIQNNLLAVQEVKVEVPVQPNQKRVSIMKVKNNDLKKDYKNVQYSLFKNTNTKSNEFLGQIMRKQLQQDQQSNVNLQNIQTNGKRQILSSKKDYTTSNDETSKRLQNRLESSRNSDINKSQEIDQHLKIVNDSYQLEKLQSQSFKQGKQAGIPQNNDKNAMERSFYNDQKSLSKQGQSSQYFFDDRTKSQVEFYKRNIKKFF